MDRETTNDIFNVMLEAFPDNVVSFRVLLTGGRSWEGSGIKIAVNRTRAPLQQLGIQNDVQTEIYVQSNCGLERDALLQGPVVYVREFDRQGEVKFRCLGLRETGNGLLWALQLSDPDTMAA